MVSISYYCIINYVFSLFNSIRYLIIINAAISVGKLTPRSNSVLATH